MQAHLSLMRILGLCLVVTGILFFWLFMPTAISLGFSIVLLEAWLVSVLIFTGCFIALEFGLKTYVKSLLGSVVAVLLVGMIFMTSLPLDLQLLLVSLFGLIIVLLSQLYLRRRSRKHAHAEAE